LRSNEQVIKLAEGTGRERRMTRKEQEIAVATKTNAAAQKIQ
jgi:hypothetical protein